MSSIHGAGQNLNVPPNNNPADNNGPPPQAVPMFAPAPAVHGGNPPPPGGNGGNGAVPPAPPTQPGNWRTDFHELHMLSNLGAGLLGPRALGPLHIGTHGSWATSPI